MAIFKSELTAQTAVFFQPNNIPAYQVVRLNIANSVFNRILVGTVNVKQYFRPYVGGARSHFDIENLRPGLLGFIGDSIRLVRRSELVFVVGYIPRMMIVAVLARVMYKNCVIFIDSFESNNKSPKLHKLKRLLLPRVFSGAIVPGLHQNVFAKSLGFAESKIYRIPFIVDSEHFSRVEGARREYFLYVGRLSKEKSVELIIDSYARYKSAGGRRALKICGDGPLKEEIYEKVQRLDLEGVDFQGWVPYDDLPEIYNGATALILFSSFEPWGVCVNEAISCGTPLILSDRVGAQECVVEGENGFLVEHSNVTALSKKLLSLDDDKLVESFSSASYLISQSFNQEVVASGFSDIKRDLCEN